MTWASLWWRVCLLGRMRRRQLSVAWRLWRRSKRPARPVRLLDTDRCSAHYLPLNVGEPIALGNYQQIQTFNYVIGEWQNTQGLSAKAIQAEQMQQMQRTQELQVAQLQQMRGMDRHDPQYLALLSGGNPFSGAGGS